ncbi:hypothetical protein BJX70DRAFT_395214 [Aspergillus crustosus]
MACNSLDNPGFNGGSLTPWYPSVGSIATVVTDDIAYGGNSYLDLQTNTQSPGGYISQNLYWLDTEKTYNLTVAVRVRDQIPTTGSAIVTASLGNNPTTGEFASDIVWTGGEWILLRGQVQPTERDTILNLGATVTVEGEVQPAHVLFDEVIFGDC